MAEGDDTSTATEEVVDDAARSAAGIRKAALWIAGALGGIPALAILGALVRAPGEQGFDHELVAWAIILSALGALIGILAFADVITPVRVSDSWLNETAFDITRVPGHPFTSWSALVSSLADVRGAHANAQITNSDITVYSKMADAVLAHAESAVAAAQARADAAPSSVSAAAALSAAKSARNEAGLDAQAKAADAAAENESLTLLAKQLRAREAVRSNAFLLAASDKVADRYRTARYLAVLSAALVAAGIYLLAIAPIESPAESALTLVRLRLSAAGKEAIGCKDPSLQAIRIGGDDAVPRVITFPTKTCPAKLIDFNVSETAGLGEIKAEDPITAPTPEGGSTPNS